MGRPDPTQEFRRMDDERQRQIAEAMRQDAFREQEMRQRPTPEVIRKVAEVVNDPGIIMTPDLVQATNDPRTVMNPQTGVVETQPFDNRFAFKAATPGTKKKRKLSKYQKLLGKNLKLLKKKHPRTKVTSLMKRAHRLTKKALK